MLVPFSDCQMLSMVRDSEDRAVAIFRYRQVIYFGRHTFTKYIDLKDCKSVPNSGNGTANDVQEAFKYIKREI